MGGWKGGKEDGRMEGRKGGWEDGREERRMGGWKGGKEDGRMGGRKVWDMYLSSIMNNCETCSKSNVMFGTRQPSLTKFLQKRAQLVNSDFQ